MLFSYKATATDGGLRDGVREAADKFDLARMLKADGLSIVSAVPVKAGGNKLVAFLNSFTGKVSLKDKIFFASNLAEMISAGLALSRALSVLARQAPNQHFKKVVEAINTDISGGGSFASALERYPDIFSSVFIAMVEAGEKSGRLPDSLRVVGDQMQKTYALRKKVRGALMYPAIILIAMSGIGVLMLVYIVPTLAATFKDLHAELPFTTKIVIGVSDFLSQHWLIALIGLMLIAFGFFRGVKTAPGKRALSWLFLHLPLFKGITQQMNAAATARTLSSLVASGVDIVESLRITEKVIQNPYYKDILIRAQEVVPKGATLSSVFQAPDAEKLYLPFVGEMIEVGEETGKLTEMLLKLAVFYEGEVEAVTKDLSTVIEPVIMIFVGFAVGFFALSMIQPIYSIGNSI